MNDRFETVVCSGSFRTGGGHAVHFPHRWTPDGVSVEADFTGAHLLHLAVAGCVLNDVHREAVRLGIHLDAVRVSAAGGFDTGTWQSTGIDYSVELRCAAPDEAVAHLLDVVDTVAEIPRAVRIGAPVRRIT